MLIISRSVDFLKKVANQKEIEQYDEELNIKSVLDQYAEGLFDAWIGRMKDKVTKSPFTTHLKSMGIHSGRRKV